MDTAMSLDSIRIKEMFRSAVALPLAEREQYLEVICKEDAALRGRLEELLAAHLRAGQFLEAPVRLSATLVPLPNPDFPECRPQAPEPATEFDSSEPYRTGTRFGRYALCEVIGEGGMGTVWVAEQTEPFHRLVALKVVKSGMDSRHVLGRFASEQQSLAMMDHSNIARVLDAGDSPTGRPYFVMELVRGSPITAYADEKRLTIRERLRQFVQTCQAVHHAHQKGIIHRDLKPSNVLVTEQEGVPVPKVIDFGIAKAVGRDLRGRFESSELSGVVGTFEYMSPEQADPGQADIDTRADVYSLGILLYELLTGGTPLVRTTLENTPLTEVLRRIREETPLRPSAKLTMSDAAAVAACRSIEPGRLLREMRRELDWIVMMALEKNRDRRYPSASELAADVQRYLDGEAVSARAPSRRYRVGKFIRRNRVAALAGAFGLLALAAGLVGMTAGLLHARAAERDAVAAREDETKQRERAEQTAAEAKAAEAKANAVVQFFGNNLLAASRPSGVEGGTGLDVTLREAVDRAEREIGPTFAKWPLAEARLRRMLGRTFGMHGEPDRSIQQYERADRLYEAQLGPRHPDTVANRGELAVAYRFVGRYADALQIHTDLVAELMAAREPDDGEVVQAILRLGSALRDAGQYARAVDTLEPVVARLQARVDALVKVRPDARYSSEANAAVSASLRLASAYRSAGRVSESIALRKRAAEVRNTQPGPNHVMTLMNQADLAEDYCEAGRSADAIPILERVVPALERQLGPIHPVVLDYSATLGLGYGMTGRHEKAVSILERVVEQLGRKPGPDNPLTLESSTKLARVYLAAGRAADAVQLLRQVRARIGGTLGIDHPESLFVDYYLAFAYRDSGRPAAAVELLERTVPRLQAAVGAGHPKSAEAIDLLARVRAVGGANVPRADPALSSPEGAGNAKR
jgi:tetratricopeptide (TPR) repeat protein